MINSRNLSAKAEQAHMGVPTRAGLAKRYPGGSARYQGVMTVILKGPPLASIFHAAEASA
jgi:hypothetical protein